MDELTKIEGTAAPAQNSALPGSHFSTSYEKVEMEGTHDLLAVGRVLHKHRWMIFTIAFVCFTVVLIGTLKMKPIYRAYVLLEIQKENPDISSMQNLFNLEDVSNVYLETQYRVLSSQSLARRVIDQLRLDRVEEFRPRNMWFFSKQLEKPSSSSSSQVFVVPGEDIGRNRQEYQEILERFSDRLEIEPVKRSRLVGISFESEDSELAAQVVNTLASNFVELNLEARWQATQKATEWLSQQLTGMKTRLEKSEDELQAYARREGLLFLEAEGGGVLNVVDERHRQLQVELTKAQATRFQKESVYRLIDAGDFGSLPGIFESRLMQDLSVQLAEVKRRRAELTATFTPDYPKVKELQSQVDELEKVLTQERNRGAQRIKNDYRAALGREKLLLQAVKSQQGYVNRVAEKSIQYNILKREVDTNKQMYEGLLQRLREAGVSAGLKASNIRIVDPAEPPEKPARPKIPLNLTLAGILGLGLGVGAAFLQEYLDNTLKTSMDVERFLRVPALALIPSAESMNGHRGGVYGLYERSRKLLANGSQETDAKEELKNSGAAAKKWQRIDVGSDQYSPLQEAFRGLRTSVLLSTAGRPPRSLLICSAHPGEGKTTVVTNLAISLAQLGQRVLLIDGDMRRPSVHKMLQIEDNLKGLVTYLTGSEEWKPVTQPTKIAGLDAMTCGPLPPNPAELLSSERMKTVLHEAVENYDTVLLDSPPLLSVADGRILSTLVEGSVLVVRGGVTPRDVSRRALDYAQSVGAHVIGVVLNNLDTSVHDGYYRYYGPRYPNYEGEISDKT